MASLRAPKRALSTSRSNRTPRILSPAPPSGSSVNACSNVPCCVRIAVLAAARMCTNAVSSSKPSCDWTRVQNLKLRHALAAPSQLFVGICQAQALSSLSAWSNPAPGGSVRRGPGCRARECYQEAVFQRATLPSQGPRR